MSIKTDKKTIVVVGEKDKESKLLELIASHKELSEDYDIIFLEGEPKQDDNSFFINGIKYAPIEDNKPKKSNSYYHTLAAKYAPLVVAHSVIAGKSYCQRQLDKDIDIIKEYGLIQLKKSKLSRWERDEVIKIFECNFKQIK